MLSTGPPFAMICDLLPGRYYDFDVFSQGAAGYSSSQELQASTEQSDPPTPPKPVILDTTTTSIGNISFLLLLR